MRNLWGWVSSLVIGISGVIAPNLGNVDTSTQTTIVQTTNDIKAVAYRDSLESRDLTADAPIVFRHGDVSWLPTLALKAGWSEASISKLSQIVLRESGGCPNRRGGDQVDKNCNITGVAEKTHRSDSGLLQINGVNYDPTRNKWAPLCLEMDICTQKPLMDPLTNLKAGKLLFDYWERAAGSGWIPWDPCNRTGTCDKP